MSKPNTYSCHALHTSCISQYVSHTLNKSFFLLFPFPPIIHLASAERFPVQTSLTPNPILKHTPNWSTPKNHEATRDAARIKNPAQNQFCGGGKPGPVLNALAVCWSLQPGAKHGRTRSVTFSNQRIIITKEVYLYSTRCSITGGAIFSFLISRLLVSTSYMTLSLFFDSGDLPTY